MRLDNACWDSASVCAARPKCPWSTTATKARTCARSRSTGAQSGTTTGCRRLREAVGHGRGRLVGCERMSARTHTESLYEHAGGDEGLHRLDQTFYDSVL